jgi:Ca-activated chloride channel homolog
MHWARPEYLNLLWVLPVLGLFFLWSFRSRRKRLEALVGTSLAPRLTEEFSRGKAILRVFLILGFFAFGILAAARPQWGTRLETVHRRGVDMMVALDTSYSMNTEDVAPNRLMKAREEIRKLVRKSEGDRIGLVTFSGDAMLQCPLTLDHGAIDLFLDASETGMLPEPGTSLASAIETSTAAFIEREKKYKVLVLFTDGEDLEGRLDTAVRKAKEAGVIIYAIGIGTPQGMPIPIRDSKGDVLEYRKDSAGKVVVSSLDERSLAGVAVETGGRYFRATTSEGEIEALYNDISGLEKKELESKLFQNYEDQFQVPLALAILFLVAALWIGERRKPGESWLKRLHPNRQSAVSIGLPAVLAIVAGFSDLRAESLASKVREGNRLFEQGKFADAENAYLDAQVKNPGRPEVLYNLGNALIKQKEYSRGIQSLSQSASKGDNVIRRNSWYNTGNALYEAGKFKDSAEAYVQALKLDPHDQDAKHNLELALLKLKEQQSGANQKQKDSDKSKQDKSAAGKDGQPQQQAQKNNNGTGGRKDQSNSAEQQESSKVPRPGSISKEQADQILDAVRAQELEQQRKLMETLARRKTNGKDW